MRTAIVLGSTGLIGSELVKLLQVSPLYDSVVLLNRRPSGQVHPKVSERIIDFDAPDLTGLRGDDLYCALGTTARKAGSQAVQHKIDCEYPTTLATQLKGQGVKRMLLVSSVGADAHAASFYLRTKAQLEKSLIDLRFEQTVIARPSFLLGRKWELRLGEEAAMVLMKLLSPFMRGSLQKYRAIEAGKVASGLIRSVESDVRGVRFIDYTQMQAA
jgi:uncharacterized protein YbjT (DUF2867 family)